jgi:hypothetical protein
MLPHEREQVASPASGDSGPELTLATERQIEKLIGEISMLVHSAEPGKRDNLKELAQTLLHQEMIDVGEATRPTGEAPVQRRLNPLAAGLLLLAAGAGLVFIVPPVGLTLMVVALVLILWGAIMSWFRK